MTRVSPVPIMLTLVLAGCAETPFVPGFASAPSVGPVPMLAAPSGEVLYVGDTLQLVSPPADGPVTVTITNQGDTRHQGRFTLEGDAVAKGVPLDAATLPGFDPKADLQTFRLTAEGRGQSANRVLDVVADRSVKPFPSISFQIGGAMPPGRSPWVPAPDTLGSDELANRFKEAVGGSQASLSSVTIGPDRIMIPPHMGAIPYNIVLREYELKGQFAKFLVPNAYSPTGRATVLAPSSFKFVITQSDPAQLVSFNLIP